MENEPAIPQKRSFVFFETIENLSLWESGKAFQKPPDVWKARSPKLFVVLGASKIKVVRPSGVTRATVLDENYVGKQHGLD